MNKTLRVIYDEVAEATGLTIDERTETLIGFNNGYHLTIGVKNNGYVMYASARQNGVLPDKAILKQAKKTIEGVRSVEIQGNNIVVWFSGATKNKIIGNMIKGVKGVTDFLRMNGYADVCECCGKPHERIGTYNISGGISFLCDDCFTKINQSMQKAELDEQNTNENVAAGVVGAFFGSLLGALAIVLIAQLGYVAAISGVIMGVCTIKGYEMMGKKLTNKGIIISLIFMAAMVYFAIKIDWTIVAARELDIDFFEAFGALWDIIKFSDCESDFFLSLGQAYAFTALGAIPMTINSVRKKRQAFTSFQIQ